jgi:hypothetical protein
MSNHTAIAAVTATLTTMIQKAVDRDGTVAGGKVTARPPDKARQGAVGNQLNLFLYQTSIDAAWRNHDPPGMRPGEGGQPPLPLVLSYLITAYGDGDDEILSHRLLGIAMGVLNDRPLLSKQDITPGSDLENQVERVRITPDPRPQDEISRMWATFGTGYRLSVSYDAAVVLIDSTQPFVAARPVLQRGSGDLGPTALGTLPPKIELVVPPNGQPAARPGDTVTLLGSDLGGISSVQVSGIRLAQPMSLVPASRTASAITLQIPSPPTIPAGIVALTAIIEGDLPDGTKQTLASNAAPLALAPTIQSWTPKKPKLDAKGATNISVKCAPPVEAEQTIALVVGTQLVAAPPLAAAGSQLTFTLAGAKHGPFPLRLRVDSVDSVPLATPAPTPMEFDPNQIVELV